jgi:hypothetical protein
LISRLITHRFAPQEFDQAFKTLSSGQALKALFEFPSVEV